MSFQQINAQAAQVQMKQYEYRQKLIEIAIKISPTAEAFTEQFCKIVQSCIEGSFIKDSISADQLFPWKYETKNHFMSPICSKRIHEAQVRTAFSCFDCRQCDNSILCYECFSSSNHDGHRYIQFQTSGGCCDCGDMEAWNENGFCKRHGNKDKFEEVDQQLKKVFYAEMKFAYFLYFWLVDQFKAGKGKEVEEVKCLYGSVLLECAANLVSEEYQFKYLMSYTLQSKLTEFLEISNNELTIIERFFQLEVCQELSYFNKISIQLFPVEQYRYTFIKQYFKKTFENEMPYSHPLKELNYQYMGRVKIIKELIQKGQLHPLLLDESKVVESPKELIELYKKYIDDMTYLIKPKSAALYFKIHFEKINICQMFFYRNYARIHVEVNDEKLIRLDEYVLKIYAEMLKTIKHQKQLLKKIMKELVEYIIKFKQISYSLIHQRAFALTAMAYLQGQLGKLHEQEVRKALMDIICHDIDGEIERNSFLSRHIKIYLNNIIHSETILEQQNIEEGDFQRIFITSYSQQYIIQSLDRVYIKILIRLYDGELRFQKLVEQLVERVYQVNIPKLIFSLSSVVVSIVSMDIDEIIICDLIGSDCKQKFFHFLKRLIKSYPKINGKELKHLAKMIINSDKYMDEFFTKEVKVEKGKIVSNFQEKPLQTFIYNKYFEKIKMDIFKAIPAYFNKIPRTHFFKDIQVYTPLTASVIAKVIQGIICISLSNQELNILLRPLLEQFLLQTALCYSQTNSESCSALFKTLLSLNMHSSLRKEAIQQANLIFNPDNESQSPVKLKQLQEGTKKKETLAKKRKQKEEIMKAKQIALLKNYESVQQMSTLETCIYCKQNNNIQLYFVAYINFTSIYEQRCLKIRRQHLFFQTCGHKIHQQCYEKYLNEVQELNVCFLCKKHVNILVPAFQKETNAEIMRKQGQEFLGIIYPTLLKNYENNEVMIDIFFTQRHSGSIVSALLQSFTREVILRAFYDLGTFKKYFFPIYSTIFDILKHQNQQQLADQLQVMTEKVKEYQSASQFKEIQLIFMSLLQSDLLNQPYKKAATKYEEYETLFQRIIKLFQSKEPHSQQLFEVKIASEFSILNSLPEKIVELLPAKPQCGVCSKLSNRLLSCLLCNWIGCDDDANCMKEHAKKDHIDGSIFVFLYNGQIIYIFQSQICVTESIYYDFLGDSMSKEKRQDSKEQLMKYYLNAEEFNGLKKKAIQHMVHNQASK